MKLGLLLFGMSKCQHDHWGKKKLKLDIDYQKSVQNYQEYIFNYFKQLGYQIDVYLSTNNLSKKDKTRLISIYKPVKFSFHKNNKNQNRRTARNEKLYSVILLCLQSKVSYDLILITRFDMMFKKKFNESNINLKKFNLVSTLQKKNLICDNFYLFPYEVLKEFLNIVKRNRHKSFHPIKKEIHNIKNNKFVNYILDEKKGIGFLSFYQIVRTIIS